MRRSSPIATNQISAARPNTSMNFLSAAGCPSCTVGRIRSASSAGSTLRKPQAAGGPMIALSRPGTPTPPASAACPRRRTAARPSQRPRRCSAAAALRSCARFPVTPGNWIARSYSANLRRSLLVALRRWTIRGRGREVRPADRSAFPVRAAGRPAPSAAAGACRRPQRRSARRRGWARWTSGALIGTGAATAETFIENILLVASDIGGVEANDL